MRDTWWQRRASSQYGDDNDRERENQLPGRRPPAKGKRLKKRLSTLLHTHVALIILCTLSVLDASCVIGQIISDILIMKQELHEKEVLETNAKEILVDMFPKHLNKSELEAQSLEDILYKLKGCKKELGSLFKDHQSKTTSTPYPADGKGDGTSTEKVADDSEEISEIHQNITLHGNHRLRRATGKRHASSIMHDHNAYEHHVLHELTHAFHLGSMVILTLLVLETVFKIFAMGKKFLSHKLEVFDAFVITVSWCLDVAFWEGLWAHPETEAANIMIFILPWRVIRIVNSFVLVIQGKDQLQLKIVKQKYRGSVKRASDLKMKVELSRIEVRQLRGLAKKHGASEKDIIRCAPEGRRRRSSLLPVLSRLASLTLLNAFGSSADIAKDAFGSSPDIAKENPPISNESSDDEDSAVDMECSRHTSVKSSASTMTVGDMSLSRTISTSSNATLIPLSPMLSLDSLIEENSAFEDDEPPTYGDVAGWIENEDCHTKL